MAQPTRHERHSAAKQAMSDLLNEGHFVDRSAGTVCIGENRFDPGVVVQVLDTVVGEARKARINEVLDGRTFGIATVVEGLANVGNAAAVMRTAEAFGFQPFHVIAGSTPYKRSDRTTQGADKWLDVQTWGSPADCVVHLKAAGYQVVATCLDERAVSIDTVDFSVPTALVFGNELVGISEEMKMAADALVVVEIPGFVESFNISVAAAISLYHAHRERRRIFGASGDLDARTRELLFASFLARSSRHALRLMKSDAENRGL